MRPKNNNECLISIKFLIACILVMVLLGAIGIWHINRVMSINLKYTEDTLQQIGDIRLEIVDLSRDIEELREMYGGLFYLSHSDRQLVERIVMAEARGKGYLGQKAVAQVIRDRAESWGKPVSEICLAYKQFAEPYQGEISDSVKEAVKSVFDNGEKVFSEVTTHFHADYVSPAWADSKINRGNVGSHRFYGD